MVKALRMKFYLIIILFLASFQVALAQDDFPDDVEDIPIDGGISILLAAGAAYGAKKIQEHSNKSQE